MTATFQIEEAQSRMDELIARAEAGEEIVIAREQERVARLVPLPNDELAPGADEIGFGELMQSEKDSPRDPAR